MMKLDTRTNGIFLVILFLIIFSITGCAPNKENEAKQEEAPMATVTPILDSVETVAIDNNEINRIDDMDKLEQVISVEEIKLSAHYHESYRSSAEYLGFARSP